MYIIIIYTNIITKTIVIINDNYYIRWQLFLLLNYTSQYYYLIIFINIYKYYLFILKWLLKFIIVLIIKIYNSFNN